MKKNLLWIKMKVFLFVIIFYVIKLYIIFNIYMKLMKWFFINDFDIYSVCCYVKCFFFVNFFSDWENYSVVSSLSFSVYGKNFLVIDIVE